MNRPKEATLLLEIMNFRNQRTEKRQGFSLIELLTVMAIISVLMTVASVGVSNMGSAQGVTSGVSIAEGLMTQAQRLAKSRGTTARLVIHDQLDDSDPEERRRFRRYMLVIYKEIDPETGAEAGKWSISGTPTLLPEKVYYSPELSKNRLEGGSELPTEIHQLTNNPDDTAECHYYEFNSQGICTTPGATFIIEGGPRPRNSERPRLGNTRNIGAFVIWRNGGTSRINDVSRIEEPSDN